MQDRIEVGKKSFELWLGVNILAIQWTQVALASRPDTLYFYITNFNFYSILNIAYTISNFYPLSL
jgi:hypothetical protein